MVKVILKKKIKKERKKKKKEKANWRREWSMVESERNISEKVDKRERKV